MPELEDTDEKLFVAVQDRMAFVSVPVRGDFSVSPNLKEFAMVAMKRGVDRFILDMIRCVGMDSTFMGVLAGIAVRLKNAGPGQITLINLTPRTRGLLSTLGVDQLVDTYMQGGTPEALSSVQPAYEPVPGKASRDKTAEVMLEAHEQLADVSEDNVVRFQDVLHFLREEVNKQYASDSTL